MRSLPLLPIALLLSGGIAQANVPDDYGPWYFEAGAGATFLPTSANVDPADAGFALHANIGRELFGSDREGPFTLAAEGEVYYSQTELDQFPITFGTAREDLTTFAVMGNLVLDWNWTEHLAVYVGGGGGVATNVRVFGTDQTLGALQGRAGMRFQLGGNLSFSLGYRLFRTEDVTSAGGFQNTQHVAEAGMRWAL